MRFEGEAIPVRPVSAIAAITAFIVLDDLEVGDAAIVGSQGFGGSALDFVVGLVVAAILVYNLETHDGRERGRGGLCNGGGWRGMAKLASERALNSRKAWEGDAKRGALGACWWSELASCC